MTINWRRWGLLSGIDIGTEGDPYLDRLRLIETPLFAVFLHHIHRPDLDRDPHDHPWWFASWVICGRYTELIRPDKTDPARGIWRERERGSLRCLSRKSAHRIVSIGRPLWTLVITGPSHGTWSWGFWLDDRSFLRWDKYLSANGHEEYAAAKAAEDGES